MCPRRLLLFFIRKYLTIWVTIVVIYIIAVLLFLVRHQRNQNEDSLVSYLSLEDEFISEYDVEKVGDFIIWKCDANTTFDLQLLRTVPVMVKAGSWLSNSTNHMAEYRKERFHKESSRRIVSKRVGDNGAGVTLTEEEQKEADRLFKIEAFNVVASNKIPLDRTLPDPRNKL